MSKKKNKGSGWTHQGVKDLNSIKAPSKGIVLELPPDMVGEECEHPDEALSVLGDGAVRCNQCKRIVR